MVAAGGWHVSFDEEVTLLNFWRVKKDREAGDVEDRDDSRIRGVERAKRHVGSEHSEVLLLDLRGEEFFMASKIMNWTQRKIYLYNIKFEKAKIVKMIFIKKLRRFLFYHSHLCCSITFVSS